MRQRLEPNWFRGDHVVAKQAAEKVSQRSRHSERSEESLFVFLRFNARGIPRSARNDEISPFFRSL